MTRLTDLVVSVYFLVEPSPEYPLSWTLESAYQLTGPPKWAIRHGGDCLNRDGDLEYEPLPSSRDADFMRRCRFATAEEALAVWGRHKHRLMKGA